MELIHPQIAQYAEKYSTEEPQLIQDLLEYATADLKHVDMISGPVVGQLLSMLIKISRAERVLEVGTFIGYSTLYMAQSLPSNAEIITCERNRRYESIARTFFKKSADADKIKLIMGDALQTIQFLDKQFDFIFLDADKVNYPNYYNLLVPKLSDGGLLLIDNIFWDGTVLNPQDEKALAINELNGTIKKDDRVQQVMLTVRDGLTLIRKQSS